MKVYELISSLMKLPAGADVYVRAVYDSGHGKMTLPTFNVTSDDFSQGPNESVTILAVEEGS